MKIGIDIDDTTFLTVKSMLKYADIFEEEISGVPTNRDSFGLIKNRYYLKALYGWDEKTKFAFFDKYYQRTVFQLQRRIFYETFSISVFNLAIIRFSSLEI